MAIPMGQFVYCLNTSTIQPAPLLEKIRLAGRHGFAAVELWLADVIEYLQQGGQARDVMRALADNGLVVPCTIAMKGWVESDDTAFAQALDDCKRRMDLAAALGAKYIVATPPRELADLALIARRYRRLLAVGRSVGIRPALEFLGFSRALFGVRQAWQIVADSNNPDATIVLDSFHIYRGGSSLADLEPIPAERIANYHFNDVPPSPPRDQLTDADRVMPGDGILDLKAEIDLLRRKAYRATVSLELFNRDLWGRDPEQVVALGMERMRELLE
jgi:sugar phosphate isomerase/epimerase